MKVNGIDARKYNAKQLTAEVLPPSLAVDYENNKGNGTNNINDKSQWDRI